MSKTKKGQIQKVLQWVATGLILVVIVLFNAYACAGRADKDVYWHYVVGRDTLANGLYADTNYSWQTNVGTWTQQEWLFDVLLYLMMNLTGAAGQTIVFGVASALFVLFGMKVAKPKNPFLYVCFAFLLTITMPFVRCNRPITYSLFMVAIIPLLFEHYVKRPKAKTLIELFLLTVLIANFHGGMLITELAILFLLPLMSIVIDLINPKPLKADSDKTNWKALFRNWLFEFRCFFVALVGSVCCPYGPRVLYESLRLSLARTTKNISEWQPTEFNLVNGVVLAVILLAYGAYVYQNIFRCKEHPNVIDVSQQPVIIMNDVRYIGLCIAFIILGMSSAKAFEVAYAMILFIGWKPIEKVLYDILGYTFAPMARNYDAMTVVSLVAVCIFAWAMGDILPIVGYDLDSWANRDTSVQVIEALQEAKKESSEPLRIGHGYQYGSTLIWNGIDCFVDPRQWMYDEYMTNEQNRSLDDLFSVMNSVNEEEVAAFLDTYDFDYVVTDHTLPIAWYMNHDEHWEKVTEEEVLLYPFFVQDENSTPEMDTVTLWKRV